MLRDSLACVRRRGKVCQAGFLGGLGPVVDFVPIADMPSGVQFSFFGSFELGSDDFPVGAVPLQQIVSDVEAGHYSAKPAHVFGFEQVAEAHELMERGAANSKIVVVVD